MKYINLISKLDLLGNPIQFKVKGNEKFKTVFGGILSSIIITLVSLLGITFFLELFNRTNPSISLSTTYNSSLEIVLGNKFPLIFYVAGNNGSPLYQQENIFDLVGFSSNLNASENNSSEISNKVEFLNVTTCSKSIFEEYYGEFTDLFMNRIPINLINSKILYCLVTPKNSDFSIINSFGTVPFKIVQFSLSQCNNKTRNNKCRPKEEINAALSNSYFNIFTPDIYFDHRNYSNPGVSYINTLSFSITTSLYKKFFIYLKAITYLSDNGVLFSDVKKSSYFQIDKVNQEVFLSGVTTIIPNSIANFCFTIQTNIFETYSRHYTNIPQILASLGGAFNSLMIISLMMNYFLEKILKEIEIFNICCTETLIKNNSRAFETFNKNELEFENNIITNNYIKNSNPNISLDKSKGIINQNRNLVNLNKELVKNFEFSKKSIVFNYPEIEKLLETNVGIFHIIFPFMRSQYQKRKINLAEKFSNQILEIDFIFGNLLETQLLYLLKSKK